MPLLLLSGFLLNGATEQDWTISMAFLSGEFAGTERQTEGRPCMPLLLLSGFLLNEATEQDWTISEAFASGNLQGRNDSKGAAAYVAPLIF